MDKHYHITVKAEFAAEKPFSVGPSFKTKKEAQTWAKENGIDMRMFEVITVEEPKAEKKEPAKTTSKKTTGIPALGTLEFAQDFLEGAKQFFQVMADKYTKGSIDDLLDHAALCALIPSGSRGDIEIMGEKIGTKEGLGGAVMGSGKNLIILCATLVHELSKRRVEATGENINVVMTEAMGTIMKHATQIVDDPDSPHRKDKEGLKDKDTATSFAEMVKDLGIDDIRNLLG